MLDGELAGEERKIEKAALSETNRLGALFLNWYLPVWLGRRLAG